MESNAMKLIREAAEQRNANEAKAKELAQQQRDAEHNEVMRLIQPLLDIANEAAFLFPDRIEVKVHHKAAYIGLKATKDPRWAMYGSSTQHVSISLTTDVGHSGIMMKGRRIGDVTNRPVDNNGVMDPSKATAMMIDLLAHAVR